MGIRRNPLTLASLMPMAPRPETGMFLFLRSARSRDVRAADLSRRGSGEISRSVNPSRSILRADDTPTQARRPSSSDRSLHAPHRVDLRRPRPGSGRRAWEHALLPAGMTIVPARKRGPRAVDRVAVALLVACALALPFFVWGFRTYQLSFAATNAIAILGLNLIAGQAGLVSLRHRAVYGLGASAPPVLVRHAGPPAS